VIALLQGEVGGHRDGGGVLEEDLEEGIGRVVPLTRLARVQPPSEPPRQGKGEYIEDPAVVHG
jgi:hypothetical protein